MVFVEWGGRWRTLAFGPIFCGIALVIELLTGPVVHWIGLAVIALVLVGFTYVQVVAARRHATVRLTRDMLQQGTEDVDIDEIITVFPEPDYEKTGGDPERWELARALGELSGVPRKRHGVGLRLRGGGLVQAWAKDEETLRERLTELVAARKQDSA
ncbi:membrane protein [Rhodococcoides trifolii]|uniref:Membrane protein n=1 Tax=Rhodococcoides trifolii TaxID=908250 RepID=A0A917FR22_9NOCA|nr:membrane protein [Rhodococcus trifolii]